MFFRFLGAQHSQFYTLRNNFCHLGLAKPTDSKGGALAESSQGSCDADVCECEVRSKRQAGAHDQDDGCYQA